MWKYKVSSVCFAHPEAVLQSLLAIDLEQDRHLAVQVIADIRTASNCPDRGQTSVKHRFNPKSLNKNAKTIREIIDWNQEVIPEHILGRL